jgi:hypothetical protein
MAIDIGGQILTAAISSILSAATAVLVLKVNQQWHKEKLERHSTSLKNAFQEIADLRQEGAAKHESQQKDIHRLEIELYKRTGGEK